MKFWWMSRYFSTINFKVLWDGDLHQQISTFRTNMLQKCCWFESRGIFKILDLSHCFSSTNQSVSRIHPSDPFNVQIQRHAYLFYIFIYYFFIASCFCRCKVLVEKCSDDMSIKTYLDKTVFTCHSDSMRHWSLISQY